VQPETRPAPPPTSWGSVVGAFALGVVVGSVGTVMHRWSRPWGVVVCLVLVLATALASRAWGGRRAWTGYAVALTATVWALSTEGPGGDVLVPAHQAIGWVWLIGAPVVAIVVALLPATLFDDRPRPARGASAPGLDPGEPLAAAPGWPPAGSFGSSAAPTGPQVGPSGPQAPPAQPSGPAVPPWDEPGRGLGA
jgi:hypothetical protein